MPGLKNIEKWANLAFSVHLNIGGKRERERRRKSKKKEEETNMRIGGIWIRGKEEKGKINKSWKW